jgi:hypothetical protein
VLLAATADAGATPLLTRARGAAALGRVETPGIARPQALRLDAGALATLRTREHAIVDGFPLGRDRTVTLALTRFSPFAPNARAEIVENGVARALPLPDLAYFRGTVQGEPDSRVVLLAAADEVHGFVVTRGDVDPAFFPPPGDFCSNDLHPEQVNTPVTGRLAALASPPVASLPLKVADVAIETDQELRAKFASDQEALDYLADLLAATTAIYERDVSVRLTFSYIRLWNSTDPWTASDTSGALDEFLSYWNAHMAAQPRDVAHMVSGKPVQGGIAYVDVLCNTSWAYGVSQVYGSFDLSSPNQIWDVEVFAHELGHNFGSPHTHCYSPPVDKCYNQEPGCWPGAVVASQGTIMSYCHLNSGGLANIDLVFGGTVSARIGTSVSAASCLSTVTTTTATSTSATSTSSTTVTSTTSTSSSVATTTSSTATTTSTSSSTTTSPTATSTTSSTTATSTTSSSSSTMSTPSTTSSSSTTASTASSTSTSVTTSSSSTAPSTSPTATTSTTSTTLPVPRSRGDADGDGVIDVEDACADTPPGDLVGATGCSVCPCDGGASGWPSRRAYVACVRGETRFRMVARTLDASGRRDAMRRARHATCGRPNRTRCCVPGGECVVVTERACTARGGQSLAVGSCVPSPCQ